MDLEHCLCCKSVAAITEPHKLCALCFTSFFASASYALAMKDSMSFATARDRFVESKLCMHYSTESLREGGAP